LINIEQANLVEDALTQALARPPELMAEIEQYCQMIHPYYDGKSSERVLVAADEMIESGLVGLKAKPLNMIREFKMRKKLHFWGF
ncbi:CDP-glycerol--glycerophosphate glycerophosphotransferase, partial [Photobacterium sp. Ph5]|nr:CDP-glycerol--glycerophosphate glycerophosphotransferase [Photobacterium sp. Ph6]MCG3876920.1 CDP-glycerol--glycerophosphate glycerophosphotransferase [Photobacterium sp. Ph5]